MIEQLTSSRPIEILLVEDNLADVRLTQEALGEARVLNHLRVVNDGVEAVRLLRPGDAGPRSGRHSIRTIFCERVSRPNSSTPK